MVAGERSTEELKRQHQASKIASVKSRMESIDSTLPSDLLRRFHHQTEHFHGGRREVHGGVKKTTSSFKNCVGEIENGKY